jgi:hypothetical protein
MTIVSEQEIKRCRRAHKRRLEDAKPKPIPSAIPTDNITTLKKEYLPTEPEIPKKTKQCEFNVS